MSLALVTSCDSRGAASPAEKCGDRSIASSAAPSLEPFKLRVNRLVAPEGCGADFKRHLIYVPTRNDGDLLTNFTRVIEDDGWRATECVTSRERCFEKGGWFVAATLPATPNVDGYPQPVGSGPQVLAVLERSS